MDTEEQQAAEAARTAGKFQQRGFAPAEPQTSAGEETQEELQEPLTDAEVALELEQEQLEQAGGTEEQTPAQEPGEEIRIGGKTFTSQTEAWAYAEELEREKLVADAFRQGLESGLQAKPGNQPAQQAEPPKAKEVPPEFYTDPAGYLAKREAELAQQLEVRLARKRQEEEAAHATWRKFYSENPDLERFHKRVVMPLLEENKDLLFPMPEDKALKLLAAKAREEIGPMAKAAAPGRELPPVKQATTTGKGAPVTGKQAKTEEKTLNFASQQKNLRTPAGKAEARKRLGL